MSVGELLDETTQASPAKLVTGKTILDEPGDGFETRGTLGAKASTCSLAAGQGASMEGGGP